MMALQNNKVDGYETGLKIMALQKSKGDGYEILCHYKTTKVMATMSTRQS